MAILNKLTWIDSAALTRFILSAQMRGTDAHICTPRPFRFCLRNEMIYLPLIL
jgi:hypothetical protein